MAADRDAIAAYLRQLKERTEWTAQKWAEKSGVPTQTISRLLNAQTDAPQFETVATLVKTAGGSLDDLVGIVHAPLIQEKFTQAPSDQEFIRLQREAMQEIRSASRHLRVSCYIAWGITGLLLFAVIGVLIYDILNLNVGWIRQQMAHFTGDLFHWMAG